MSNYHEEEQQRNVFYLRTAMEELPPFLQEFFRGIAQSTSVKTQLGYAHDLKLFFQYICKKHPKLKGSNPLQLSISCLDQIDSEEIDRFMEYITYYERPDPHHPQNTIIVKNDEKGKARKLAAVRSMYKFFYKKNKVSANPASIVDAPKIHEKQIVRLDVDEVAKLLDEVESGENLTKRQKAFHNHTKKRDLALITLLLGTGMRVSECVGINMKDIDFSCNGIKVTRKGGNEVMLYFGEEVREALEDYLVQRQQQTSKYDGDDALFLSSRGTRITVRAVQNLVKKYASLVTTVKKISPHKLRSTYGTNLYHETGDIYLVADVLGHADVNTTKKHYAAIEEERRRSAAKYVKLRKD
jgi:integrase/recombinase XerC